jgi:nitrate/TMAO reductase-like tetraheme cytochrome c subunit
VVNRVLGALARLPERLAEWAGNLSAPALGAVGVLLMAGVGAGGYYAYRTYDYVQHDNDFCVSCHLMQEPANLFAASAHAGLGCKACHQPTLVTRTQMALTQILENPEEIAAHAEVPNELCANCHIQGDPARWRLVANSAGHKAHLESDDPKLQGLQCVECHATSLHEFAPVDRTCAQAGCHEDKKILLAGMSNLTIHCSACHNFLAPVRPAQAQAAGAAPGGVESALLPDRDECLSCHAMRSLVKMPEPDPHQGVCASCHNPHEQRTPQEAMQSCTDAGCHTQAAELSPMHKGMQPGVLEACTYCHKAHDFKVDGTRCLDCHQDLDRQDPAIRPRLHADSTSAPRAERVGSALHLPATLPKRASNSMPNPHATGREAYP